jgi:DNA-binding transcriptional LysR family regulator
MADALKRANRESRVVVQAPSTASVRTALATGLGVGVLRRRQVDGASDLQLLSDLTDPLPAVAQVLRFSRGLSRRIAAPLKSMILTSPLLANLV